MISYDEFGEYDGCTHAIDPDEMDLMESAEAAQVIADAAKSLHGYAVRLHEKQDRHKVVTDALNAQVAYLLQRNRILAGFAEWAERHAKAGLPASEIVRRATRALAGEERTTSKPPRKPEEG